MCKISKIFQVMISLLHTDKQDFGIPKAFIISWQVVCPVIDVNCNIALKGKSDYHHMTSVTLEAPPMVWNIVGYQYHHHHNTSPDCPMRGCLTCSESLSSQDSLWTVWETHTWERRHSPREMCLLPQWTAALPTLQALSRHHGWDQ